MKLQKNAAATILASLCMLMLILDSKTALDGAVQGVELCIRTVIPSLFPFFVLSIWLTSSVAGSTIPPLRPLGKLCGIPNGAESLLVIGLLGGYPVGAKNIRNAYDEGLITRQEAQRMLGFCNNAGPAFIFGIAGGLFSSAWIAWILWGIHIVSALLVGAALPQKTNRSINAEPGRHLSLPHCLNRSVTVMGEVCGWIILFRIFLAFSERWFLWLLPDTLRAAAHGVLELVNGCHFLYCIPSEGVRFVLCSAMLAFGGLCVAMQTTTVAGPLGTGWYFPGKVLQCVISILLALPAQFLLFPNSEWMTDAASLGVIAAILIIMLIPLGTKLKKTVAFQRNLVYNR